jgi:hypothetical protein
MIGAMMAAFTGMALLALSQKKHWDVVMRPPLRRVHVRALRTGGSAMIAAALALLLLAEGPAYGAILWPLLLALAAASVTAIATVAARISESRRRGLRT